MNQNTWISWLTTGIGLAGSAAVTNGVIDSSTAATISGVAAMLVPVIWGYFVHSDSAVVRAASNVAGVAAPIQIAPEASASLQALALDKSVTMVQSAALAPSPYATSRRV